MKWRLIAAFLFEDITDYDADAKQTHLTAAAATILADVIERLTHVEDWQTATLKAIIKETTQTLGVKMPQVAQPMRVALTGNTTSPSIDVTLALVGRERSLARLAHAQAACVAD